MMVNFALIGLGKWGRNHLATLETISGVRLKYICSPHIAKKDNIDKKYIKVDQYQKLFKFKDVDGIIIATPALTHYQIASGFLGHGFNVFVEKPMTTKYSDAVKLLDVYKGRESCFMIGHIDIYAPAFQYVAKNKSKIGKIKYMSFETGKYESKANISALWDWAPHDVAKAIFLMGKPMAVSAWSYKRGKLDLLIHIRLIFKDQSEAYIRTGWLLPAKTRSYSIIGSKGAFIYNDITKTLLQTDFFQSKQIPTSKDLPLKLELTEFRDSILKKRRPLTDLDHGGGVIKILSFAQKSINEGGKLVPIK